MCQLGVAKIYLERERTVAEYIELTEGASST